MTVETVLQLRGLDAGYRHVPIVRGASFELHRGEVLGLIGRNGVGKTTLVSAIMGLVAITAGEVHLAGRDITRTKTADRARWGIGYVPQGRGIFTRLTVEENLRMGELVGPRMNGDFAYERVYDLFPTLAKRRRQRGGSLSGGEQQQLAIGRALVNSPAVLILDEPSEGVQPSIVETFGDLLARLQGEGSLSVLLVEQNWDLVTRAADRAFVMDKGEVVASLTRSELNNPELATRYLAI